MTKKKTSKSNKNKEQENIFKDSKAFKKIKETKFDTTKWTIGVNNRIISLFSDSVKDDNKLKKSYGLGFFIMLCTQLLFTYIIFVLVGCKVLKYNSKSLNIFVSGTLIETFAVIHTIVKYLFNNNLVNALNTILENSNTNIWNDEQKKDIINSKNIDVEKALRETKIKRQQELANKKIIIDGKVE